MKIARDNSRFACFASREFTSLAIRVFLSWSTNQVAFIEEKDDNTEMQGLDFYCQFVCVLTDGQHSSNI